jgi:mannitol 2-dehydrogenase
VQREVVPSLTAMPGMDLNAYQARVLERFANPAIRDPLLRISTYGSSGIPQFLLPSIEDQLARGDVTALSFVMASWFRALAGTDDQGRTLTVTDPMAATLREIALRAKADPATLFTGHDLFGPRLAQSETFKASVTAALQHFYQHGASATLQHTLSKVTTAA